MSVSSQQTKSIVLAPSDLKDSIDWNFLFVEWDLHGRYPEIFNDHVIGEHARALYEDAVSLLERMEAKVRTVFRQVRAFGRCDDIVVVDESGNETILPQLRNQTTHFKCLSDYLSPDDDQIVLFAVSVSNSFQGDDDYNRLMSSILCDRLADAMLTRLEEEIHNEFHRKPLSIAYGYPAAPDHSGKKLVYDLLKVDKYFDLQLTENYSMKPTSSIMGFIILNDNASYFNVGRIGQDQLEDYARRAGLTPERLSELIPNNI